MSEEFDVDYGDLTGEQIFKIDQKAYTKYYMSCYENFNDIEDTTKKPSDLKLKHKSPLMYNSWYGTELHKRSVIPLLRKMKLDKINKKADD